MAIKYITIMPGRIVELYAPYPIANRKVDKKAIYPQTIAKRALIVIIKMMTRIIFLLLKKESMSLAEKAILMARGSIRTTSIDITRPISRFSF